MRPNLTVEIEAVTLSQFKLSCISRLTSLLRYADGGTESFIWLKVLSTDPDLMVKSKGDLKKGSGNVESKNCG